VHLRKTPNAILGPSSFPVVVAQPDKKLQTVLCWSGMTDRQTDREHYHNKSYPHNNKQRTYPYKRSRNKVQSHSGGQPSLCTLQIYKTCSSMAKNQSARICDVARVSRVSTYFLKLFYPFLFSRHSRSGAGYDVHWKIMR